jgi:hypothetical protein
MNRVANSEREARRRARPWLRWPGRLGVGFLLLVLTLGALRVALPYAIKAYINRDLNRRPGYSGHVTDVRVSLWRGAYRLYGLEIHQLNVESPLPLFTAPETELSVLWSALIDGKVVAQVRIDAPKLNFVAGRSGKAPSQVGQGFNALGLLKRLAVLRVDRLEIRDGQLHFLDPFASPKVDVQISQLQALASHFTARAASPGNRVASVEGRGRVLGQAPIQFLLHMDPAAKPPDFDLRARMLGLDVVHLREVMQAYTRLIPKHGTLDVVLQADAHAGVIHGNVKPLFHDLQLFKPDQEVSELAHPLSFLADAVGSVFNFLFQNQSKKQLATDVPFSGPLKAPDADTFAGLVNVLKNAFVKAYGPQFEKSASH